MKIAVIGAGAIGSIVAAYLSKAAKDVVLVGRQDQVEAIEKNGLRITGINGDETIQISVKQKLDTEPDLVIFATKTQDLEDAYIANSEYLENCLVLSSQNGVQADNILSAHFDHEKMYSSIVMFGSTYVKPGEITYNFPGDWIIGKPFSKNDANLEVIVRELKDGFSAVISEDITSMKWLKLFINFNNCIPAVVGKSMQETFADMDLCKLSILLLKEGLDIIQQGNIQLLSLPNFPAERILGLANMPIDQASGIINKTLTTLSEKPLYGSILQSILRKRTSEIDFINGETVAMAKQMSLAAPMNEAIVGMVHEVENSGDFFAMDEVKKRFEL